LRIQNNPILKKNILLLLALVGWHSILLAQKKQKHVSTVARCYTMERVKLYLKYHPEARANTSSPATRTNTKNVSNARSLNTEEIINIPVVFHIVLDNPYLITGAAIQSQINELNTDFAGLNADSTNAANFYSVRGHSLRIRFVLAKRTPAGIASNGIDRVASHVGSNANLLVDPVKRTALGGADAWDPDSYLNCWISNDVSGKNILGYAQFPGEGIPLDDGIFCSYESFGTSDCNNPTYNKGRTLCHEIGHYFGLFHIWGDEDGCDGDDFRQLSDAGSSVILPFGLFNKPGDGNTSADIGDTPNQGPSSGNCFSGTITDNCSPSTTGKMYQNYMDYTPDDCYSLFTKKQVERMEWVMVNFRSGLKTSLGATAPVGMAKLDASPYEPVSPGGVEAIGCASFTYPSVLSCPGSINPKIRIRNNGTDKITTLKVGLLLDGVAKGAVTVNIASGLVFGETTVVNFPSISATTGTYKLQFYTYNVNGNATDLVSSNDTLSTTLTVSGGVSLPAFEDFQNPPFPAHYWSVYNPNGDGTWHIVTIGSNSSTATMIDNYSKNNIGYIDELRTPKFLVSPSDSLVLTFDLAHKNYPGLYDSLSVLVSNNCGTSWTSVYAKAGDNLATAGFTTLQYSTPAAEDWRSQKITLAGNLLSTGQIIIAFRNTGGYGNNIFIDNIRIYQQKNRDIFPAAILSPANIECASFINVPKIVVANNGQHVIKSFKVGYHINNEPLVYKSFSNAISPGDSVIVSLDTIVANIGNNSFSLFTYDPQTPLGIGDEWMANDTINKKFVVNSIVDAPLTGGFEDSTFAPVGWQIINPNDVNTWVRKFPGSKSNHAAFIDNYSQDLTGQADALKSPAVKVAGADSIIISFDLAHKNYNGAFDQLQLKVSSDCGNNYSTVFNKSGSELATAGSSDMAYETPVAGDWKEQRISLDSSYAAGGSIIALFENTSDYGNNVFIDNISISKIFKRDVMLVSIKQPTGAICSSGSTLPVVTVKNVGVDTITALKISYSIDNGPADTKTVTGIAVAANQQLDITLNSFNSSIGEHSITIFSFEPVSKTGIGDLDAANDTLHAIFTTVGTQPVLPLKEDFEQAKFPPQNWGILHDGATSWTRSTNAASNGTAAMVIHNFNDSVLFSVDKFVSPEIANTSKNDSVFARFDLAYKQRGTAMRSDTLEILVTTDCGTSFQTVWKKWGENLQTVSSSTAVDTAAFVPTNSDWKNIHLYLTPFVGTNKFQLYFVAKSNQQNDVWIDNINIYSKILPKRLKQQGYLIYPNPFSNIFLIHHYQVPVNLQAAQVYNVSGQLVWDKRFNRNATTEMTVDLTNKPKGVYVLKLSYRDKTVQEKIVKN
jgi:hypothetical protein